MAKAATRKSKPTKRGAPLGGEDGAIAADVDAWFAAAPPRSRTFLHALCAVIRAAAPGATEGVRRGALAFAHDGRLVELLAFPEFCILFVPSAPVMKAHAAELAGFVVSTGARLPVDGPVPEALVTSLVSARLSELRAKKKKK